MRLALVLLAVILAGECASPPEYGCRQHATYCDEGFEGWGDG